MSPDRLNFNHVFYFHVVAEEGSISKAAQRLRVTKPTVSEQVRQLEDVLGAKLFVRKGGSLELTSEGRGALSSTRRMFSAASSLVDRFATGGEVPTLRVGVASSVSRSVTADFFRPLFGDEQARVILRTASGEVLPRLLVDGDLDLAITDNVPLEPGRRGLVSEKLTSTPVVIVTSATARTVPRRCVLPIRESPLRRAADDYLARMDGDPVEVLGETDDVPTALALAAAMPCLAFVPEAGARRDLVTRSLRLVDELPTEVSVVALYVERDAVIDRVKRALASLQTSSVAAHAAQNGDVSRSRQ